MNDLLKPVIEDYIVFATHNMPCAVCHTAHAVIVLPERIFHPCWGCQQKGWILKKGGRLIKFFNFIFSKQTYVNTHSVMTIKSE